MLKTLIKKPTILLPKKHIILISHMRANTTLLGHIFGSHPDVSGYYEHHIGYYSWKSLVRNKLKFHTENPKQSVTKFQFDKILHNEHQINTAVLQHEDVSLLFMLRKPERTIKSIIKLYKKIDGLHDLCNPQAATQYYVDRLLGIEKLAINSSKFNDISYIDAESIIDNTQYTLKKLSSIFGLVPELKSEYDLFTLSGKAKFGDPSKNIRQGKIQKNATNYDGMVLDDSLLQQATQTYNNVKNQLLLISKNKVISSF